MIDESDRRRTPMPALPPTDPYRTIARALSDIAHQWEIANMIKWREIKNTQRFPNTKDDVRIEQLLGLGRK